MSIASKLGIKPAEADDVEVGAALDAVETARKLIIALETKAVKNATLISGKRKSLAEAALASEESGDTKAYQRIEADLLLLDADAARLDQAQVAANARVRDAEANLHAMGVAQHLKTIRRLTVARTKAATEMVSALELYAKNYMKLLEVSDRIVGSWSAGIPPQGGGLLWPSETEQAVQKEIGRIAQRDPLSKIPHVPGSVFSAWENPAELVPFIDQLQTANDHLIALVQAGPK